MLYARHAEQGQRLLTSEDDEFDSLMCSKPTINRAPLPGLPSYQNLYLKGLIGFDIQRWLSTDLPWIRRGGLGTCRNGIFFVPYCAALVDSLLCIRRQFCEYLKGTVRVWVWRELIVSDICGAKDKIHKFYLRLLDILCLPGEQALQNKIQCAPQVVLYVVNDRLLYMSNLWIIRRGV